MPPGRGSQRDAGSTRTRIPRPTPCEAPGVPAVRSAGVLLYRVTAEGGVEVLLGHMGGPFWARKDQGAWSVPKGEHGPGE